MRTAVNDQGQKIELVNNQWIPVKQAVNDAGDKLEFTGGQWTPLIQQPQDTTFGQDAEAALSQRGERFGKQMEPIFNDMTSLNPLTSIPANLAAVRRVGGLLAGGAGDVIGAGISNIADTLTPEPLQERFKDLMGDIGQSAPVQTAMQAFSGFEQQNPGLGQDLRDLGNMAGIVPVGKAAQVGLKGVGAGVRGVANKVLDPAKPKAVKKLLSQANPSKDLLLKEAGTLYDSIDDLGGTIKPQSINKLVNSIVTDKSMRKIDPSLHPEATAALKRVLELKDTSPTASQLVTLREIVGDASDTIVKKDSRLSMAMLDKIDGYLDTLDSKAMNAGETLNIGGKLRDARKLYSRGSKARLIEETLRKARNQKSGFENGIRIQIGKIRDGKKAKFFNKDELKAMDTIIQGTTAANIAKALGKFGFGIDQATNTVGGAIAGSGGAAAGSLIGGAGGAGIGAIVVPAVGTISKKVAESLTLKSTDALKKIITAGTDGENIVKAYMQKVPKSQRDLNELTELLVRPDIDLSKVNSNVKKGIKDPAQIFAANAIFFAQALRNKSNREQTQEQQ